MFTVQHLQQKYNEIKKDYEHYNKLISGLRNQWRHQTGADVQVKLKLEQEITEAQAKHDKMDQEMTELENKINSLTKPIKPNIGDDNSTENNHEKVPVRVRLDGFKFAVEPDFFDSEDSSAKAWTHLHKIRAAQQADQRVPDGLKDPERKVYRRNERGEQIALKANDRVYADEILESRPDATKG